MSVATELERAVISRMLAERSLRPLLESIDFSRVTVTERIFTGAGFFTTFDPSDALRAFEADRSLRWSRVGAKVNERSDIGFVVYVDEGRVRLLEGFTFGEEWPESIVHFETYSLREGGGV